MKKFLSLVLALVMTMSLVTISAGAKDFNDDSKITYKEAVDVVSALGIVDGYTDGSFNPTATLSRGAAAKIICNLILGPTTASALSADTAPFSDVPANHTFAGYIAYCSQKGIISGYADGTFRPAATLTGYAFMKMLLGALGYDAQSEGYVGANWSVAVAKQAISIDLDEGNDDFVGVNAVTREEACLYAFNTLTADMVTYDSKTTVEINGATVVVGGAEAKKIANSLKDDYRTYEGDEDGDDPRDTVTQFCEEYFPKLELRTGSASDGFGRPANTWYNKSDKIGVYAKTADKVYTAKVESGDLYKDLGLSEKKTYTAYTDGAEDGVDFDIVRGEENDELGGNGTVVEVFKDDKTIVVINTYVGQVDVVEEESSKKDPYVQISDLSKDSILDNDEFETEDFEEDDIVLYTYSLRDDEIKTMVKAEEVTGEVSKFTAGKNVTLDGTQYKYSAKASDDTKISSVDVDITAYLDASGYVIYTDDVEVSVAKLAYVLDAGADSSRGGSDKWAKLLYTDGTVDTVTTSKVYGTSGDEGLTGDDADNALNGKFVSYKTNSSNKVVLTEAKGYGVNESATVAADTTVFTNGKAAVNTGDAIDGFSGANSSTLFLLYSKDDDEGKVYTGMKKAPTVDLNEASTVAVLSKSGKSAAIIVIFSDKATTSSSTNNFLFLRGDDVRETTTSDDTYYVFDAVVDGKIGEVMLDSSDTQTCGVIDLLLTEQNVLLFDYSVDGDLYTVKLSKNVSAGDEKGGYATSNVKKASGGVITFDDEALTLADEYSVFKVSASGKLTTSTLSAVRTGTVGSGEDDYYAELAYSLNSDGEVTGIYYELNK